MSIITNDLKFMPGLSEDLDEPTIFEPKESAKRPSVVRVTEEHFRDYRVPQMGPDTWRPFPSPVGFDMLTKELDDRGFLRSDAAFLMCTTTKNNKIADQGPRDRHMMQMTIAHPDLPVIDGYRWNLGLLNSYDMTWALRGEGGSEFNRCSNGEAWGIENAASRKHTVGINKNYDDTFEVMQKVIAGFVDGIVPSFEKKALYLDWQKNTECTDEDARYIAIEAARDNVVNAASVMRIMKHWWTPEHPEFKDRNVWSLMQAFTSNDRGRNMSDRGSRFKRLESMIKGHFNYNVVEDTPLFDGSSF